MPELFSVPRTQPRHIGALRKFADQACSRYAKALRKNPDSVWRRAMNSDFGEIHHHEEGREFAESFWRLRAAERMTILHYTLSK
jgi:hypothetical protein